ncbi:MAG TPA: TetR family transcriptional regulator [Streptosporangiales bacterium]
MAAARKGDLARERLLAAATELIAERGWTGVSTRLLAERAGVGAGVVHYHFPSMQALLSEAALAAMRGALAELGTLLERAEDPDDVLDLVLVSLDRYTGRDPLSVVFVETYLASTRDRRLRRAVARVLAEFTQATARWLAEHDVERPEQTAAVFAAAVDGVLLHRSLNSRLTANAVAPVLRRLVAPAGPRTGEEGRR